FRGGRRRSGDLRVAGGAQPARAHHGIDRDLRARGAARVRRPRRGPGRGEAQAAGAGGRGRDAAPRRGLPTGRHRRLLVPGFARAVGEGHGLDRARSHAAAMGRRSGRGQAGSERRNHRLMDDRPSSASLLTAVADRMTDGRFHCWYWGDAIAVDGLLEADALGAGAYRGHVVETLQRWNAHCLPNFDDVLAPGAAIVQLVMDGELPESAAQRMLARLGGLPMVCGSVSALEPQRLAFRYAVCIDAVYHLPATYALASRWRDDAALAQRAVAIAVDSMQVLRCETGWAQWFDPTHKRNNNVAWSRGLGWAVLGLLDLVRILCGEHTGEGAELAGEVLGLLGGEQHRDGPRG